MVSPDNKHVYVTGFASDSIAVFSRNTTAGANFGKLTFRETHSSAGLNGADSVAISPDGKRLYVAAFNDDAIVVFQRNTDKNSANFGNLTFVQTLKAEVAGVEGLNGISELMVSPDGKHVYAASCFDHAISMFRHDSDTGK